jgi:hypothetical protein
MRGGLFQFVGLTMRNLLFYLQSKIFSDGIVGIIGASCGDSQVITLAENSPIKVISFYSSSQREENIKHYESLLATNPR